jgi:threonine/homoserine/homoserine lactone efflux protein
MLETIYKGILVGLFVSIPLGPIGMLCIQRTLNRGQKYGIATGIGATASDLLYTIVSLFFLSFVLDIIEQYKFLIQISGSAILIIFGYFIFNSHPSAQPKPHETKQFSLFGDFITSFGLTLSNPLVLFVLIALFAKFEFITNESTFYEIVTGICSILLGAILWWSILTFLVSKFRQKLNINGLRTINKITGTIIICIGLIGLIVSAIEKAPKI